MKLQAFAFGMAAALAAPSMANDGINYSKVNFVIAEITGTLFSPQDIVKNLTLRVNPQSTNLNQSKLAFDLGAQIKSAWSTVDSELKFGVQLSAGSAAEAQTPLFYNGKLSLQTDVVGLVNYLVKKFYGPKIQNCADVQDMSAAFCQELRVLSEVQNLGELQRSLQTLVVLADDKQGDALANTYLSQMNVSADSTQVLVSTREGLVAGPKFTWAFNLTGVELDVSCDAPVSTEKISFTRAILSSRLSAVANTDAEAVEQLKAVVAFVKSLIQGFFK